MSNTIGIIGTGAITEAVVTGLCSKAVPPKRIVLSPRNQDRAKQLAGKYGNVEIAKDNESVISESRIIFIAVRPQIVEDVLNHLSFTKDHHILSFVAGYSIEKLRAQTNPAKSITRMIPLPSIARHEGPIILSPPSKEFAELFQDTGTLVEVEHEKELETLCAVTALMAPYFGLLDGCVDWLASNGVERSQAFDFTRAMFNSLGRATERSPHKDFSKLSIEYATPMGFNEQAFRELTHVGWYDDITKVLNLINSRLEGNATFEDGVEQ
jgi:pyrroline-5-carboxylate reductase